MNHFFQNATFFFKRYFIIVLVSIIIGNLIAWKNGEKSEHFYQYVIKVRSRIDYFDLVRSHFEKISKSISDSSSGTGNLKSAPIESYRNEDFYFVEMKLRFADTSHATEVIDKVVSLIKADGEMKAKYFDRLENMDGLINDAKSLIRFLSTKVDSSKGGDALTRVQLFQSKVSLQNLVRDRNSFEQNVSMYFPTSAEYNYVQTGNSMKTFITATVLFFIIGLFVAVVVDRFRN
jgi:hypothetical protein